MGAIPAARLYHTKYRVTPPPRGPHINRFRITNLNNENTVAPNNPVSINFALFASSTYFGCQTHAFWNTYNKRTFEPEQTKTNKMSNVASEDPEQPGSQSSPISLRCPHEETLGP